MLNLVYAMLIENLEPDKRKELDEVLLRPSEYEMAQALRAARPGVPRPKVVPSFFDDDNSGWMSEVRHAR